jgi:hypothetical protein
VGRVEQQRIQLLALARFGEVMGEAAVEVATRPFIRSGVDRAFKRCDQRLVLRDEPLFPRPIAQEVTNRIVESKKPLSEIEIERQSTNRIAGSEGLPSRNPQDCQSRPTGAR